MMVIFVSRSEKKSLNSTRRVLDAFADRIGDNTWRTVITEDGLEIVKKLLRRSATKNTAVACHWIRSRSRSDLVWIVGNRNKFNKHGIVPVNTTRQNLQHNEWENDWEYLPQIKALTAVAALFHDWGKSSILFQEKLKSNRRLADPLRHEWVSCVLLYALVASSGNQSNDEGWMDLVRNWSFDEAELVKNIPKNHEVVLEKLPPIAQIIAWMILSHHRLPALLNKNDRQSYVDVCRNDFSSAVKSIRECWGYKNDKDNEFSSRLGKCFTFQFGLLKNSMIFAKQAKKWLSRLVEEKEKIYSLLQNKSLRLVLNYARLSLMLGDHYVSSLEAEKNWNGNRNLFANTNNNVLKQHLDEHLVRVSNQALKITQFLARFSNQMEKAYDVKSLKQKSSVEFAWQDNAVEKIKKFRDENHVDDKREHGWFVVNMASTGCGKTIANAKIMQAISEDGEGLRYILALGLRTLTLQTGDEYRERIGLNNDELAVLIGSAAVKELHEQKADKTNQDNIENNESGSESQESLLDEDLDFVDSPTADFLDGFFPRENSKMSQKNKAFLYKPILTCTIDHIITATETTRGGKYILPFLRLMSSDLVIDEIDDFGKKDLIAIGRLVHLAGMLGRSVTISSATIPPDLAEGLFNAYQEGWECYRSFYGREKHTICVWCDEFKTKVEIPQGTTTADRCKAYDELHKNFVAKRIEKLREQVVKRKAYIVNCNHLLATTEYSAGAEKDMQSIQLQYFEIIKDTAKQLHSKHHFIDQKTGKKISFGVVRVANIPPCVEIGKYLIGADWGGDFSPKVMVYHSRQTLLLRHEQEKHLDMILKRKEKPSEEPVALSNLVIRNHIDNARESNVIFILVATPVEEVGRDHDFDWAIIEPSSFRSIIQMAGRILRHRKMEKDIAEPNIAIMQYNLRGLRQDNKPAFCRPGYETSNKSRLHSHAMDQLVNEAELRKGVNAIPRIIKRSGINPHEKLDALEHAVMHDFRDNSTENPNCLQGWLSGYWWLTALPQQFNSFRESSPEVKLYLIWKDGIAVFCEKTDKGNFEEREFLWDIEHLAKEFGEFESRLWLSRNYKDALLHQRNKQRNLDFSIEDECLKKLSEKFGEVTIPKSKNQKSLIYSDQFGLFPKS